MAANVAATMPPYVSLTSAWAARPANAPVMKLAAVYFIHFNAGARSALPRAEYLWITQH